MLIESERHGSQVVLTLNRPKKLNALNYELIDELMDRFDALDRDDRVRCLVLKGRGDRAYSTRADIAGFARNRVAQLRHARARYDAVHRELSETRHCSPQRYRLRRGLRNHGSLQPSDSSGACVVCLTQTRLGFTSPFGGTQRLPRHIGRKRANEMIPNGEAIRAEGALLVGLINHVVPASDLLPASLRMSNLIAAQSAVAVTASLCAVARGLNVSIDKGLAIEAVEFLIAAASPHAREGTGAFLEKRPPVFLHS